MVPGALHVDQLLDARLEEEVVTAADPFVETQVQEQASQVLEVDVRVAAAPEDLEQSLLMSTHRAKLAGGK